MEEKQSRVRWNDQELSRLAAFMAPRLLAEPQLHSLDAVRAAQDCLEPDRRRELKAWSLVEGRLQPKLDEALARLRAQSPEASAADCLSPADSQASAADGLVDGADGSQADVVLSQPADDQEASPTRAEAEAPGASVAREAVQVHGDKATFAQAYTAHASEQAFDLFGDPPAPQGLAAAGAAERPRSGRGATTASGHGTPVHTTSLTVDPARIEAALVAALQSPAVEEALVEVFARAMSKALLQVGTGESRATTAPPTRQPSAGRVLLAGFPEAQQKALTEVLGASFEVRSWKPANGPQLFETLARLCRTVVFPEDADDEVEAGLKGMDVRVIRHAGSASRLLERLGEAG